VRKYVEEQERRKRAIGTDELIEIKEQKAIDIVWTTLYTEVGLRPELCS
jgi:hypothetical protein